MHTEKLGRVRTCRIEPAGFRALEQWIRDHRTAWERKLDRLGAFLAEEDEASSAVTRVNYRCPIRRTSVRMILSTAREEGRTMPKSTSLSRRKFVALAAPAAIIATSPTFSKAFAAPPTR